jgi:DNA polymerase-1
MFRAFFALPTSITDAEDRPVNALLGTTNLILWAIEQHSPRAVVLCFGPDAATYRVELYPRYHADRPPMPEELAHQWARADDFFGAFGWYVEHHDSLEADDLLGSLAAAETEAGGHRAALHGRPRHVPVRSDRVAVLYPRGAKDGPGADRARRGPQALRRRPRAGARLHRAARRPERRAARARRGSARRRRRTCFVSTGTLDAVIAASVRLRPDRGRAARRSRRAEGFREIATLVRVPLDPPPDRPTDWAAGARRRAGMGMRRLSERLERLAET